MENISQIKKVFIIGIGGVGISALAKLFHARGILVSGINDEVGGATTSTLEALGIEIIYSDKLETMPEADLYVYSDAWIYRGPMIIEKARTTGKPTLSYFEALGLVAKEYKVIAIAGTHGKTTTTAMVAEMMIDAGLDPTVVVGSFIKSFGSNFRKGSSGWLVVEADEYMRHFLNFTPYITVITNIEADHLDYYKNLDDVVDAFQTLVKQTSNTIVCACHTGPDPVSNNSGMKVLNLIQDQDDNQKVEIVDYSKYVDSLPTLSFPGLHNRQNGASAKAVGVLLGIPEEKINMSLQNFSGTLRRLEKKGITAGGAIVYDDYAHHPTEAKASLEALREIYPSGEYKITVVFQPHLYSRTKALFDDFIPAFDEADVVGFLPIYFAREDLDPEVSSEKLALEISKHKQNIFSFGTFDEAEDYLRKSNLGEKDVIVTMGAGEAYKVGESLLK
jgi:UDP-N-acetylmuramate--alanine ligase